MTAGPWLSARGGARERLSCGAGHWRASWARGERCAGEVAACWVVRVEAGLRHASRAERSEGGTGDAGRAGKRGNGRWAG